MGSVDTAIYSASERAPVRLELDRFAPSECPTREPNRRVAININSEYTAFESDARALDFTNDFDQARRANVPNFSACWSQRYHSCSLRKPRTLQAPLDSTYSGPPCEILRVQPRRGS